MPYVSDKQRRFFHSPSADKAGITKKTVKEFDKASKGMELPEKAKKMAEGGEVNDGLNLSNFKKVHEDDNVAHMQDKSGHKIIIAKKMLSEPLRKRLTELPLHKAEGTDPEEMNFTPDEENTQGVNFTPQSDSQATLQDMDTAKETHGLETPETIDITAAGTTPLQTTPTNLDIPKPAQEQTQTPDLISPDVFKDMEGERSSIIQQGKLAAEAAAQQAAAAVTHQAVVNGLQQDFKTHSEKINNEIENLTQDAKNGHVNPNQYVENMSTVGKVTTALGMILSGIGSGLAGGPNLAAQFLDRQIDRNIEAQKANITNKNNVLSALYHQMGNEQDATNMYKAFEYENYAAKAQKLAAKAGGPMAMEKARQLSLEYKMKADQLKNQVAMNRTLMQAAPGKGMDTNTLASKKVEFLMQGDKTAQAKGREELAKVTQMKNDQAKATQLFDDIANLRNQSVTKTLTPTAIAKHHQELTSKEEELKQLLLKAKGARFNKENLKLMEPFIPGVTTLKGGQETMRQQVINSFQDVATPTLDAWNISVDKRAPIKTTSLGIVK